MKKELVFKNREGAALVFVIMALLVLIIFTSSVAFIFASNHKQALIQEKNIKEHYLKSSAIDVTISTLLSTLQVDDEGIEKTMIDVIRSKKENLALADIIEIDGQKVEINLFYDGVKDKTRISSNVVYGTDVSKKLSAVLEFSGTQYRMIWE